MRGAFMTLPRHATPTSEVNKDFVWHYALSERESSKLAAVRQSQPLRIEDSPRS